MSNEQVLAFIEQIKDGAIQGQKDYGVFASVTIAQGIIESTYGTSKLAKTDNNLFGIKFPGKHDPRLTITQGTWATDDGGYYCHYQNWNDSILDHGYFLKNNSRYTENGVFNAKDCYEQVDCIANAGYASDPNYAETIKGEIRYYNLQQYDNAEIDDSNEKVENAVTWAINIANDDTHGYDQANRWGPDYDCSSFVISAYEQSGIPLKSNGANSTVDLKEVALKTGFHVVEWNNDINNLVRGDIILNESSHVCMYIGNGQIVHASINEFGGTTGGKTGDQTGKEIYVRNFYIYSKGWDCVLRYKNGSTGTHDPIVTEEVWKDIKSSSYNINQLTSEEIKNLKKLTYKSIVNMVFTWNRSKRIIGFNLYGNKLTFDEKTYKIINVRNNGFLTLQFAESGIYKVVNPKYIKEVVQ